MPSPQTYTLRNEVPTLVTRSRPDSVTVYNMSSIPVFLSAEQTGGFELSPGSTITWDAGQALYAFHRTPGATADIAVLPNGGQIVDSRALARNIVDTGLAQNIATEINALGVPAIDRPTVLAEITKPVLNASVGMITPLVPKTDVSQYSSIRLHVQAADDTGSAAESTIYAIRVYHSIGSSVIQTRDYTLSYGTARVTVPIIGNGIAIDLVSQTTGIGTIGYTFAAVASMRDVKESVVCETTSWGSGSLGRGSVSASGQTHKSIVAYGNPGTPIVQQYYPSWMSGRFDFSWGFRNYNDASKNTTGITVVLGPDNTTANDIGNALMGDPNYTSTTPNALRRFSGISSWARPVLTIVNRNAVDIVVDVSFAYEG